jgi:hypothetical protein
LPTAPRAYLRVRAVLSPCSLGLSVTSQQYFYLRTNQPSSTSQQYSSLRTNQHQPSSTSRTNRSYAKPSSTSRTNRSYAKYSYSETQAAGAPLGRRCGHCRSPPHIMNIKKWLERRDMASMPPPTGRRGHAPRRHDKVRGRPAAAGWF